MGKDEAGAREGGSLTQHLIAQPLAFCPVLQGFRSSSLGMTPHPHRLSLNLQPHCCNLHVFASCRASVARAWACRQAVMMTMRQKRQQERGAASRSSSRASMSCGWAARCRTGACWPALGHKQTALSEVRRGQINIDSSVAHLPIRRGHGSSREHLNCYGLARWSCCRRYRCAGDVGASLQHLCCCALHRGSPCTCSPVSLQLWVICRTADYDGP